MDDFARLNLIGRSPPFLAALGLIGKFATCDATVLIQGETGTGKDLAARAIHYLSRRRDLPFVPVNCGALPDNLVESELFGHVRGAFTDAKQARVGLVAQARGGTLFLDEIEAMSPRAQVALLRFLQDKVYRPVGGGLVKDADVRVVASSNADLRVMVQRGLFRSDLLFRLNVLSVQLPPLRARGGDVVMLAEAFLRRLCLEYSQPIKVIHPDSVFALNVYPWPGNVRELENLIHRELLLASGPVIAIGPIASDAPDPQAAVIAGTTAEPFKVAKARAVAEFERSYIAALLTRTAGDMVLASRIAGKDRSDLGKLLKKYGLVRKGFSHPSEPS
jgi:DNA-binding NtrC family response regulator